MTQQNKELAVKKVPKELRHAMASMGPQFKLALPSHISPERFTRIVFTAVQRNPKLLDATQDSVLASVMRAAEQGLMPDGRQGALVPYFNGKTRTLDAQWIPMWQGLLDLARQSGAVDDAYVASVRENDDFEYELGLERKLSHKPALTNRGEILFVYAVILLSNGAKTFGPGPMTVEEVNAIRARSKTKDSGPWVSDWEAMAWKTVLKRALKYVPQSAELQQALEQDNIAEFGQWKEPEAKVEPTTIEGLMAQNVEHADDQATADPLGWPQQHNDGTWVDSAGMNYNPTIHAGYRGIHPTVNSDGSFRARKGAMHAYHEAYEKLAEAKQQREGETAPDNGGSESDAAGASRQGRTDPSASADDHDRPQVDLTEQQQGDNEISAEDAEKQNQLLQDFLIKCANAKTKQELDLVSEKSSGLIGLWADRAFQIWTRRQEELAAEPINEN